MPRKKPEPGPLFGEQAKAEPAAERPSSKFTGRELWRFVRFYCEKVRPHPPEETVGVIRNIQRMLDSGIPIEDIALALKNYADDEWRKSQDPRYSLQIRSFFKAETIKLWQTPRPRYVKKRLPDFQIPASVRPAPVVPTHDDEVDEL